MRDDSADGMLREYLGTSEDADAERLLGSMLDGLARTVVSRIVSSVCRGPVGSAEGEDLVAETLTDLLQRLRELRADPSRAIRDLRGYIATCAYNRCHARLRERHPARNRLRNQVQYLCGQHARLASWRTAQGVTACGLREWAGREPVDAARAERVRLAARTDPAAENRAQLVTLVPAVFREAGGPLDLDTLVDTVARLIGLEQQRVEVPLESIPLNELAADTALELRGSLRELWDDVRQLAPKQRAALLLNLRDAHGRECLSLLPLTRTATIAEIADVVEIPPERFAALWNELPLSDVAIAELLHATARQVIKLRRLARERLRRMEKNRTRQNLGRQFDSSPSTDLALVPRGRNMR
ncbi:MAG TPA: hypothetical protein VF883_13995 [Thermoanaerobaculia bacterium]